MPTLKGGYRQSTRFTAVAVTATQRIRVQEPLSRVFVPSVAVMDDTTAAAVATIGIEAGGEFYPVDSVVCTTAGVWYQVVVLNWIYPGESIRVDWSSVVVADVLAMDVHGNQEIV